MTETAARRETLVEPGDRLASGSAIAVIVNRTAGRSRDATWERDVFRGFRPTFVHPANGEDTARLALAHARAGAAAIVVAGGDGTVNRVVNAVADSGVPIALLPCGTANDLARQLDIPTALEAAADRIAHGRVRTLDLVDVNGRAFATVGGLGLPASCALSVVGLKHGVGRAVLASLGTAVYPLVAAGTVLLRPRDVQRVRVTIRRPGGRTVVVQRVSHGLLLANQGRFGGRLTLPTRSRNDDGIFEIAVLSADRRPRLLATLAALRLGLPISRRALGVWRAVEARIECERPLAFFGDGEAIACARRFRVRIRPGALRVVC